MSGGGGGMASMRITRGGKFRSPQSLKEAIQNKFAIQSGAQRASQIMAANTPVGRDYKGHKGGTGRASWQVVKMVWEGDRFVTTVSNSAQNRGVYYIPIADVRSKRNAGFIARGLSQAQTEAMKVVHEKMKFTTKDVFEGGGSTLG